MIPEANIGRMAIRYISFLFSRTFRNFPWAQIFDLTPQIFFASLKWPHEAEMVEYSTCIPRFIFKKMLKSAFPAI